MINEQHTADYVKTDYGTVLVHGGVTYAGKDPVGSLCRKLKQGTLRVYRDGKESLLVYDVSLRADQTLREDDIGFHVTKYEPFPESLKK